MAFNLGTIESKVRVDGLAQFGDDLKRADATMDAFAQQTSKRMTRVETDVKAVAKSVGMSAQDMQGQLDRALKSISADTATKSLERMARQMGLSKQEVVSFGQQMGLSAQTIEGLTAKLAGAGSGMSALVSISKPLAGAIAGAFSVGAITNAINEIANVKMQFEAFDRTLKMVTGSQTGAALALESLSATSDRLGLKLTDAAAGYKLIGAAAKGTVLEGTAAKSAFEGIASAASVLGMSASDANGVMLALSQVISKGKVQAEELRGQIGERLPGAFQIAARAMGMTTVELDKLMSTGGLLADDFVPKFAAELQKTFGQGATEAGNSTQASFNKMQNAWDQLKAALGDTSVFSVVIAAMNKTAAVANAMAQSIRQATGTLQGAAKVASLQSRLDQLQGPDAVYAYGGPENYDPAKVKAEIEKVTKELAAARQDIEDTAQEQLGKSRQNAINKQHEQEQAAIKGGEKATLDAWAASADKKVALWANQQKEVLAAYEKANKGEITQGAMSVLVDEANKKYADGLENLGKKGQKAANQAARYAEQTAGYLQQAQDQYDQLVAQLGGDALGAKLAAIDKRYDAAGTAIRKGMIGAKGSTDEARAALEQLEQNRAIEKLIAEAAAWTKSMQDAATMLGELGRLSGDPTALYGSTMTAAQSWESEQKKRIGALQDEAEQEKQLGELRQIMALKDVEAKRQAYEGMAAVSSKYWDAERERIEAHLEVVKKNAEDETAYKMYAAQEWDAYNKKLLEQQVQTAGTFGETLSAKLSLAFGGYKSEAGRAKESWIATSDSIITATDGTIDAVAGGVGDMVRSFGSGCTDIESLWRNMLSRMADVALNFFEDWAKRSLKDLAAGWFSGSSGSGSQQAAGSGGTGGVTGTLADIKQTGKYMGSGFLDAFSGGSSQADSFVKSLSKANTDGLSDVFKSGNLSGWTFPDGSTAAGSAISAATGLTSTATSVLSTVGTALGVVGAVGGLIGLATSLFGEQKKEIKKTAEGYNVGYSGGAASVSGVDFYSDGSTVSTGVTDPAVVRKVSQAMEDAAKSISDSSKLLGFSTEQFVDKFNFPSMNVTGDQLDGLIANMTTAMAFTALDQAGLRGAVEAVAKKGETYDLTLERLGASYQTVGGYTEAYGYDLQTLAGITQESIDALRETNTQVAQGTLPAMLTLASAMGATGDIMSVLASTATDTSVALNVTDEQLSKILQADYASQIEEAVGGEDAFKTIMGNLVKNTLNSIDAYQKQAVYYTNKSNEAFADLKDPSVTIDSFWASFDAAMKRGLTVDDFEAWADASSWVNNFDTISEAITDFYNTIEKLGQSLQARAYKAMGMDTASSASAQIASNRWELYDADQAGYDGATLAAITATQGAEVAKSLRDIFDMAQSALDDAVGGSKVPSDLATLRAKFDDLSEAARILGASEQDLADIRAKEQATIEAKLAGILTSVSDQADDATRTDTEKWYSSLHKSIEQSIEDARALGASEQQLSDIRQSETTIIAAKLGDMMGDIHEALSTYNGTELAYSVSSLKQEMAGKLYDAALMGATQADLTDVGTLYAYKVKAAYQSQIDTIVSQLKTAAQALDTFSTSLKDFLDGLWTDSDVSPLTVTGQYAEAQSQWRKAAADLSSTDDAVRQAAQDKIQGLTTDYLKLSQDANVSAAAYYTDFAEVQTVLGDSYKQAKTDHDILQAQLDAATGTEDHTKTTAELMDQLHNLQAQQGATWTQMMADLPKNIADALAEALGFKKTGTAGAGAGGGGGTSLGYGAYGSADAWDAAYVAAEQSYLEQKAAALNAAGTDGKTDWTVYDVAKSISDLGLTPYQHFFEYGSGETNTSTGAYLSWGQGPTTPAPRNLSTGGDTYNRNDVIGYSTDIGSAFNESAYLSNKVDQLNATATGGRTNWTTADVQASLAGLGMTPEQHFAQYGQYEGVKPYATGGLVADLARSGGYLPGYSATDIQPAILRLGEYVMTPEAVSHWGLDTLNAMNSWNVRGYASGGLVSPSPVSRPIYPGGSGSSSSSNDAEVKALRQEVAELKDIVRDMARDMSQGLDRLVANTNPQ